MLERTFFLQRFGLTLLAFLSTGLSLAQERPVPDTYTAVTTNMTPEGVELKADVLTWSDEAARAAVIEAMAAEDPSEALSELPTAGVVWRSGSAVGNSIKYAHRSDLPDGGERVVLVTDRRIGATSFNPWTAGETDESDMLGYSVIELRRGAGESGQGTMSLAAEVLIDASNSTITLSGGDSSPMLLTDVALEPKPYWASQN
jgi:hypothetical protein